MTVGAWTRCHHVVGWPTKPPPCTDQIAQHMKQIAVRMPWLHRPGLRCYPSCFMLKQMIRFSAGGMGRLGCAFTSASLWQIWSWANAAQRQRMPLLPNWWPGLNLLKSKRYRSTLWILRAHQRGEMNAYTFFVVVCNRDLCLGHTKAVSSLVCTRMTLYISNPIC